MLFLTFYSPNLFVVTDKATCATQSVSDAASLDRRETHSRCLVYLQVHNILAEMVMGGMVLETNMNEIITQVDAQNKMEKSEVSAPPPASCMYNVILHLFPEVWYTVCRHVCMLHHACYSSVAMWMLPTYY